MTTMIMRWVAAVCVAVVAVGALQVSAQQAPPAPTDPRVGLKAGLKDAGMAAKNIELLANMPRPENFGDPMAGGLNFANSDLAFKDSTLFLGNFYGFNFYDIEDPRKIRLRASIPCPGGQGDLSVYGNLLFMSVEQGNGRVDCGTQGTGEMGKPNPERFRGVRIFDISDLDKPRQVAAVQTCRGSHTHSLVPTVKNPEVLYVYGSGTSGVRETDELAICSGGAPGDNPETALFSIDVIEVPLKNPENARIVSRPRIFQDYGTGAIAGLWPGGRHGEGTQASSTTNQCHDITVYPELGLAAGACSGNGILLDVSDPVNPVRLDAVSDPSFAYWHSATFNNDGTKVIFTDEWGGGTSPRCRDTDLPSWGANAIFEILNKKMVFRSYFKLPAAQTATENCVAHNGSLIPVPGRDIKVQAWYQGGLSIFDFTDATRPVEIAYFDRGPISAEKLIVGGYWSVYWYNGHIYGSEIARGVDVLELKPSEFLSQNEIDAAKLVKMQEFNAQSQPKMAWPNSPVVARAYVDQLTRSRSMTMARGTEIAAALTTAEKSSGASRAAAADALTKLIQGLETDAKQANPIDARKYRSLIGTITGYAATLK
ncbi:MAG: hypothetical protein FJW21_04895 [Acidimicrobiia bacterium]|nr:hypothetical protein [Acidimicrobiia bacterium]